MTDSTQERIKSLEQRLAHDPQSPLFARLAAYYLQAGKANDALRLCDDGLAHYPYYSTAHLVKGKALIELRMMAEAKHEYEVVHEFLPTNETVARLYSSIDLGPSTELSSAPPAEAVVETEAPIQPTLPPAAEEAVLEEPQTLVAEEAPPQEPIAEEESVAPAEAPPVQEVITEEPQAFEPREAPPTAEEPFGTEAAPPVEAEQVPPTVAAAREFEVQEQPKPTTDDFGFGATAEAPPLPAVEEVPFSAQPIIEPLPTIEPAAEQTQEVPAVEPLGFESVPPSPEPAAIEAPAATTDQTPDWFEAFSQLQQPPAEATEAPPAIQPEEENPFAIFGAEPAPTSVEGESFEEYSARIRMELFGTEDTMTLDEYLKQSAPAGSPQKSADKIGELAEKLKASQRITPPVVNYAEKAPRSSSEAETSSGSGFVTPTLAEIYVKQGWYDDAIKAYRALATNKPAEKEKYEQRIAEIEEMKKKQ